MDRVSSVEKGKHLVVLMFSVDRSVEMIPAPILEESSRSFGISREDTKAHDFGDDSLYSGIDKISEICTANGELGTWMNVV